jgi:hypothetical protein
VSDFARMASCDLPNTFEGQQGPEEDHEIDEDSSGSIKRRNPKFIRSPHRS